MKKSMTINRLEMIATMLEDLPEWRKEFVFPKEMVRALKTQEEEIYGIGCYKLQLLIPTVFDMRKFTHENTACAIGHALYHPWFQSRGLYMDDGGYIRCDSPSWGFGLQDYDAISHFFGIPEVTAYILFGDQKEQRTIVLSDTEKFSFPVAKTRFQVAKNIRDYVANYLDKDLKYNADSIY